MRSFKQRGLLEGPLLYVVLGLGAALALSMAGNAFLWNSRDAALKQAASMEASRNQWLGSATLCSAETDRLVAVGEKRAIEVQAQIAKANALAKWWEGKAWETMQTPPAVPGDACASSHVLNQKKLLERRGAAKGRP